MGFHNEFEKARDFLILYRSDYSYAYSHFTWPKFENFNWALDYFDPMAEGNFNIALWIVDHGGNEQKFTFDEMAKRSNQAANYLRSLGLEKGDSLFLLMEDSVALWEISLAAMKLGAILVPNSPLLSQAELHDRLNNERIKLVITSKKHTEKFNIKSSGVTALVVEDQSIEKSDFKTAIPGWKHYNDCYKQSSYFETSERTKATDPLVHYFTPSHSLKAKLVEHSMAGFTVGHLSTMYWMGLKPGDVHLGINSPGWAMHDWNNFIAPWNAEATIFIFKNERFNAKLLLDVLSEYPITTFCAPPTVWRILVEEDLTSYKGKLREALSSEEALNVEIISKVFKAWGIFVRDGYVQTETAALVGVPPGEKGSFGTMGKVLPGFKITLLDNGKIGEAGEVCLSFEDHPFGIMSNADKAETYFHTGDFAFIDETGNYTFTERLDGLFKSSGYRISPIELEKVLKEFAAVGDAVVIPSPDPIKDFVPKACVALAKGYEPTKELAMDILNFSRTKLSAFKRIRRLEFIEPPKNAEGGIARDELINREKEKRLKNEKSEYEFWEEDSKIMIEDTWAQEMP